LCHYLASLADDPLFAGSQVAFHIAVMSLPMGRGHQHADVPADHLVFPIAEEPLASTAEGLDDPAFIDSDHRIGGGIDHRLKACLLFFKPPILLDPEQAEDGRRPDRKECEGTIAKPEKNAYRARVLAQQ